MRIVMLLLLCACGVETRTCEESCDGCCSAGVCLSGSTAIECGSGGLACDDCSKSETLTECAVVANVRSCHAPPTDAGQPLPHVFVTLHYAYLPSACGACAAEPQIPDVTWCVVTAELTQPKWDAIRTSYLNCGSHQVGSEATLDCNPECGWDGVTLACTDGATQTGLQRCGMCNTPPGTSATKCEWRPQ